MINEVMYGLGSKSSVIRELFSYGLKRKKVVGADKVYDFSLGNPSIPAPHQVKDAIEKTQDEQRLKDLHLMKEDLVYILDHKPATFHQALQLFWLYALCAGCINYGRMDIVLGPYLKHDIDTGLIDEDEAYRYVKSLWTMI